MLIILGNMYKIYISKLPQHSWVLEEFNLNHLYCYWPYWLQKRGFWRLVSVQSAMWFLYFNLSSINVWQKTSMLSLLRKPGSSLVFVQWSFSIYIDLSSIKARQKFSRAFSIFARQQDGKVTIKQELISYQTLNLL